MISLAWCWSLIVDQLWCWSGAKPGTIREFDSSAFGLPTTSLASYSQLIRTWMNAASRIPSREMVGKFDSQNKSSLQSNTRANSMTWALLSFSIMSSFQMHVLVCRIIFPVWDTTLLCVLSCQWNLSSGQRSRKTLTHFNQYFWYNAI